MPLSLPPVDGWLLIGKCRVELASREITGPDSPRPRRITPKALAVLRLFAQAQGKVLSREYLLTHVWTDTEPTDDVLTQAITQLRKAFAALDASQAYIETIARSGYRMLLEVRYEPGDDTPANAAALPPVAATVVTTGPLASPAPDRRAFRRRRRRWMAGVLVLLLLTCLGALCWSVMIREAADVRVAPAIPAELDRPYRLLTATEAAETHPALSSDGSRIAYSRTRSDGGIEIVVQSLAPNAAQRVLSVPPAGARDRLAAWSPDGSQIAFSRHLPDGRCAVLLAAVEATLPPVSLMRCDRTELLGFDWSADGQGLIVGTSQDVPGEPGLSRLDIATRQWHSISYPRSAGDLDAHPRVSPDGRWIVFARHPQLGRLYRMPAGGGEITPVTEPLEEIRGHVWLPDSRHLLVARWVGSETRLFLVDALADAPGMGRDLGIDQAVMPAVSREAPVLAFIHRRVHSQLMAVQAGGLKPLYPAGGQNAVPSLSPDAQRLLFVSDRSGVPGIWLGDSDGKAPARQFPGVIASPRRSPAWAPDGERALVVGGEAGGKTGVYELDPDTLGVVELPVPGGLPLQVSYTGNDQHLLLVQQAGDRPELVLYDRTRSPWVALARVPDVSHVAWDAAAKQVVVARRDRAGLFVLPADLQGEPRAVSSEVPLRQAYRNWSVDTRGQLLRLASAPGCQVLLGIDAMAAGVRPRERCVLADGVALPSGFAGSADRGPVVAIGVLDHSDIALMSLSGTGSSQVSFDVKSLFGKGK